MLTTLIVLPCLAALVSWLIPTHHVRRGLLASVAGVELLLACSTWIFPPAPAWGELLNLDPLGQLVLTLTCLLFFAASIYAIGYLKMEDAGDRIDLFQGLRFCNAPESTFTACLFLFLAAAVLVACTQHLGLLWVGIETTTLASAPLIYFHRHKRSLEATWKYLIICSVGIAFALVGNLLLDISMQKGNIAVEMTVSALSEKAFDVHPGWFKAAFVFLLVGYGTKMGVAPMHTWLPDAHSEAPSLVSALLSGALLNCAFLGIVRIYTVSLAINLGAFSSTLLTAFGFISLLVAAIFIVGQGDFKRMLAYSSVEHMGILLIGLGASHSITTAMGSRPPQGWVLHMMSHSLIKGGLFMLAGNILARYHTKSCHDVTGLFRTLPATGLLWLAGILAITGTPPFALFSSEFSILQSLLVTRNTTLAVIYLVLLGIIFAGMLTPVLRMCQGSPPHGTPTLTHESLWHVAPSAVLIGLALALGLILPSWLHNVMAQAARLGIPVSL